MEESQLQKEGRLVLEAAPLPGICMDPGVRIPSNWKDAIGKPLTGRKINEYAKQGRYGPQWKALVEQAQNKKKRICNAAGIVYRCLHCGSSKSISYLRFSYLPKAGDYCTVCREHFRSLAEKAKELDRKWKERYNQQYE